MYIRTKTTTIIMKLNTKNRNNMKNIRQAFKTINLFYNHV